MKSSAPASKRRHAVLGLVERRHHHDRQVGRRRVGLDPAADLEPVHARHDRVDQHEIGMALGDHPQRLRAVMSDDHVHVLGRELRLEQRDAARRIIDQEDARAHGYSGS
jgi:hypothetical protein